MSSSSSNTNLKRRSHLRVSLNPNSNPNHSPTSSPNRLSQFPQSLHPIPDQYHLSTHAPLTPPKRQHSKSNSSPNYDQDYLSSSAPETGTTRLAYNYPHHHQHQHYYSSPGLSTGASPSCSPSPSSLSSSLAPSPNSHPPQLLSPHPHSHARPLPPSTFSASSLPISTLSLPLSLTLHSNPIPSQSQSQFQSLSSPNLSKTLISQLDRLIRTELRKVLRRGRWTGRGGIGIGGRGRGGRGLMGVKRQRSRSFSYGEEREQQPKQQQGEGRRVRVRVRVEIKVVLWEQGKMLNTNTAINGDNPTSNPTASLLFTSLLSYQSHFNNPKPPPNHHPNPRHPSSPHSPTSWSSSQSQSPFASTSTSTASRSPPPHSLSHFSNSTDIFESPFEIELSLSLRVVEFPSYSPTTASSHQTARTIGPFYSPGPNDEDDTDWKYGTDTDFRDDHDERKTQESGSPSSQSPLGSSSSRSRSRLREGRERRKHEIAILFARKPLTLERTSDNGNNRGGNRSTADILAALKGLGKGKDTEAHGKEADDGNDKGKRAETMFEAFLECLGGGGTGMGRDDDDGDEGNEEIDTIRIYLPSLSSNGEDGHQQFKFPQRKDEQNRVNEERKRRQAEKERDPLVFSSPFRFDRDHDPVREDSLNSTMSQTQGGYGFGAPPATERNGGRGMDLPPDALRIVNAIEDWNDERKQSGAKRRRGGRERDDNNRISVLKPSHGTVVSKITPDSQIQLYPAAHSNRNSNLLIGGAIGEKKGDAEEEEREKLLVRLEGVGRGKCVEILELRGGGIIRTGVIVRNGGRQIGWRIGGGRGEFGMGFGIGNGASVDAPGENEEDMRTTLGREGHDDDVKITRSSSFAERRKSKKLSNAQDLGLRLDTVIDEVDRLNLEIRTVKQESTDGMEGLPSSEGSSSVITPAVGIISPEGPTPETVKPEKMGFFDTLRSPSQPPQQVPPPASKIIDSTIKNGNITSSRREGSDDSNGTNGKQNGSRPSSGSGLVRRKGVFEIFDDQDEDGDGNGNGNGEAQSFSHDDERKTTLATSMKGENGSSLARLRISPLPTPMDGPTPMPTPIPSQSLSHPPFPQSRPRSPSDSATSPPPSSATLPRTATKMMPKRNKPLLKLSIPSLSSLSLAQAHQMGLLQSQRNVGGRRDVTPGPGTGGTVAATAATVAPDGCSWMPTDPFGSNDPNFTQNPNGAGSSSSDLNLNLLHLRSSRFSSPSVKTDSGGSSRSGRLGSRDELERFGKVKGKKRRKGSGNEMTDPDQEPEQQEFSRFDDDSDWNPWVSDDDNDDAEVEEEGNLNFGFDLGRPTRNTSMLSMMSRISVNGSTGSRENDWGPNTASKSRRGSTMSNSFGGWFGDEYGYEYGGEEGEELSLEEELMELERMGLGGSGIGVPKSSSSSSSMTKLRDNGRGNGGGRDDGFQTTPKRTWSMNGFDDGEGKNGIDAWGGRTGRRDSEVFWDEPDSVECSGEDQGTLKGKGKGKGKIRERDQERGVQESRIGREGLGRSRAQEGRVVPSLGSLAARLEKSRPTLDFEGPGDIQNGYLIPPGRDRIISGSSMASGSIMRGDNDTTREKTTSSLTTTSTSSPSQSERKPPPSQPESETSQPRPRIRPRRWSSISWLRGDVSEDEDEEDDANGNGNENDADWEDDQLTIEGKPHDDDDVPLSLLKHSHIQSNHSQHPHSQYHRSRIRHKLFLHPNTSSYYYNQNNKRVWSRIDQEVSRDQREEEERWRRVGSLLIRRQKDTLGTERFKNRERSRSRSRSRSRMGSRHIVQRRSGSGDTGDEGGRRRATRRSSSKDRNGRERRKKRSMSMSLSGDSFSSLGTVNSIEAEREWERLGLGLGNSKKKGGGAE